MSFRTYSDGTPKRPRLGTMCASGDHRVCGGWWCICPCHGDDDVLGGPRMADHVDHEWEQVGPCVYCCGIRLYQGSPPTERAEREAMVAILDGVANKAVKEWALMRAEVRAHIGATS